MIRKLQSELAALIKAAALEKFSQAPEKVNFSRPPKIELGDRSEERRVGKECRL